MPLRLSHGANIVLMCFLRLISTEFDLSYWIKTVTITLIVSLYSRLNLLPLFQYSPAV